MTRAKTVGALAAACGWAAARLPGVAGAALVSAAAWLVYVPAGLAVGGVFLLAADWRTR
ncbi:hypothetical protein ABZU94_29755 [Streptomyces mirabilis]|uniref:hypothetical protein n=1 Tax=Streptomyces sp. NPDC005388 TaxID=3156717 RepID=UPI0033BC8255